MVLRSSLGLRSVVSRCFCTMLCRMHSYHTDRVVRSLWVGLSGSGCLWVPLGAYECLWVALGGSGPLGVFGWFCRGLQKHDWGSSRLRRLKCNCWP